MVLFTHNVKKINAGAHKNGDVDGTCKQSFSLKQDKNLILLM